MRRPRTIFTRTPHRTPHRPGTVYVLVLVSAMIVAVIGLVGVTVVRQDLARSELNASAAKATTYAQSAIELGLTEIKLNPSWRTTYTNGSTMFSRPLGTGRASLTVSDPNDSNLSNSISDTFLLRGTGIVGGARQLVEVKVIPTLPPLPALSTCMSVGGTLTFTSGKARASAMIWSGGNVTASNATIAANVQSAGTISGSTFSGTRTPGVAAPTMPTKTTVISTYGGLATSISYGSLTSGTLQKVALSSGRNPFGSTNASGVYMIDCGGQSLTIRDSRIVGTLVIKNAATVTLAGSLLLQASSASMPVLIVDGNVDVTLSTTDLYETTFLTNFNPSGVPYLNSTDIDTLDYYPAQIQGLVAIFGNLSVQSSGTLNATSAILVTGNASIQGALMLADDTGIVATPPSGFTDTPTYSFDDTSWKRALN